MTAKRRARRPAKPAQARTHDVKLSLDQALTYATSLLSSGRGAEALKIYGQLAELTPDQPDRLHFHGIALHQTASSSKGLAMIERSLALMPRHAGWWNNHGNVLREIGRLDDAIDSFQRAIEIDPVFAQPYNNLGIVQREKRNLTIAEMCFKRAIELDPEFAEAYFNHGNLLMSRNRAAEGIYFLLKAVTLRPGSRPSRRYLALAYGQIGEFDKARQVYEDWLREEPGNPIACHHLAAVSGQMNDRCSDQYVREVFDEFAPSFDSKLSHLDYRAPELVNAAVRAATAALGRPLHIVDAGCGTGLCGPGLRDMSARLIGVDLSNVMLAKARERGCYDQLHEAELTAFLSRLGATVDAVVSADTLCYFGDLSGAFAAAASSLTPGGVLVFTVEALGAGEREIALNHHGRYAHTRAYVERALPEAGFTVRSIAHEVLRVENAVDVDGLVVVATRLPASI
jgi:predicted TPR repeat methyltransferase